VRHSFAIKCCVMNGNWRYVNGQRITISHITTLGCIVCVHQQPVVFVMHIVAFSGLWQTIISLLLKGVGWYFVIDISHQNGLQLLTHPCLFPCAFTLCIFIIGKIMGYHYVDGVEKYKSKFGAIFYPDGEFL